MYWTDTPDGHHCTRHDYQFPRGEVCHQCVTDPPPAPDGAYVDEEEVRRLRANINDYRSNYRACLRRSAELSDGTEREHGHAVKWQDCSIKWARLAEELQSKVDGYVRDDRLIREDRKMAGARGSN